MTYNYFAGRQLLSEGNGQAKDKPLGQRGVGLPPKISHFAGEVCGGVEVAHTLLLLGTRRVPTHRYYARRYDLCTTLV
jgi:hypothetical protein